MVNDESIDDHAKQQSVIINLGAINFQEQSERDYISEYACASVQYFLHNYTHPEVEFVHPVSASGSVNFLPAV